MILGLTILIATPTTGSIWLLSGGLLLFLLLIAVFAGVAVRRLFSERPRSNRGDFSHSPRSDNPAAFMTASMQAVIQKLRVQEKELEALHRAERERAKQTERLSEAVTRNMPAALLLLNSAGMITTANPAAEVALEIRSLPYRRYNEVLGADSKLSQLISGCLEQGRTYRREEIEYLTPSRELRQLGVTISPIVSASNELDGALCLLSDLTELVALQKKIHTKENLAALGEMSAGIAHEFKNALATISGYAQMIRTESEPGTEIREYGEHILDQTRSLAHVVTEFLKFARPLDVANEHVTVRPMIERVVDELSEVQPGVTISVEGSFGEVSGDEGLLRQAILNLVRNAVESVGGNPGERRVVVRGEVEETGAERGQKISIADNGPGIGRDSLPKIFLPFYTTKANGTGLGLAVVQKIVVHHGGTVEARNQSLGGAEFVVWLPFAREALTAVDSAVAGI
jgi:nitrogen-specific signal transduction histidine kinase